MRLRDQKVHALSKALPVLHQGKTRNCGPYATTMALSFYLDRPVTPTDVARAMRWHRVPLLGATLPWGVPVAVRAFGLQVQTGYFGTLADLKFHIQCDRPVVILARPTDLPNHHFYDLHYRVMVGFHDDTSIAGGGEIYFNCSSAVQASNSGRPGNVTLSYQTFLDQWPVGGLLRWYAAIIK